MSNSVTKLRPGWMSSLVIPINLLDSVLSDSTEATNALCQELLLSALFRSNWIYINFKYPRGRLAQRFNIIVYWLKCRGILFMWIFNMSVNSFYLFVVLLMIICNLSLVIAANLTELFVKTSWLLTFYLYNFFEHRSIFWFYL